MRYLHILAAFASEPWALQPEKLQTIISFLAFKAGGGMLGADEIQARIGKGQEAAIRKQAGDIAVIPVMGTIMQRADMMNDISGGCSTEAVAGFLNAAVNDDTVKAIVMHYDSGGGGVFGVQELGEQIAAAAQIKPVIASIDSACCSAAYWLASQATEITCTPGGIGGSIGVYSVHEDLSKALEMEGVTPTLVKAGDNKAETINFLPLSDDARAAMQTRVDQTYDTFVRAVAAGRKTTLANVKENYGQGRSFQAPDLLAKGMVDRIETFSATLARLGGTPMRGSAGAAMRAAIASGDLKPSHAEDVLRDAGLSRGEAKAFMAVGFKGLSQRDAGDDTKKKTLAALRELNAQAAEIIIPKLSKGQSDG